MPVQQQQPHSSPLPFGLLATEWAAEEPADEIGQAPRVSVTRFRSVDERRLEFEVPAEQQCYLVGVVLRRAYMRIATIDRTIHSGFALPGQIYVIEPGVATGCLLQGPCDVLHLRLGCTLVAQGARALADRFRTPAIDTATFQDPIIERLALALVTSGQMQVGCGRIYADSIGMAIVARILAAQSGQTTAAARPPAGLMKWRLKRALDYIEAHLADHVSLADMANAAGLTRMHFAAQFKIATGLRPHEFVLRRRVERAQEMLLMPKASLIDVALEVGFHTQAHFTSVFKRFVGTPPHAWREVQDRAA